MGANPSSTPGRMAACAEGCCSGGKCWLGVAAAAALKGAQKPAAKSNDSTGVRWVWHGGLPMRSEDITEGGLPGYIGLVKLDNFMFGDIPLGIETWPDYRIGSMAWPSGMLLAEALAKGLEGLPEIRGKQVAELGAGPAMPALVCGKLGAAMVAMTDRTELLPLMDKNIEINDLGGNCRSESLDWVLASDSALGAAARAAAGEAPLDVVLGADVVYFEEQEPLMEAMAALLVPGHTVLVLAYRQRTEADRRYLMNRILPSLQDPVRIDFTAGEHGTTEIYVGKRRMDLPA